MLQRKPHINGTYRHPQDIDRIGLKHVCRALIVPDDERGKQGYPFIFIWASSSIALHCAPCIHPVNPGQNAIRVIWVIRGSPLRDYPHRGTSDVWQACHNPRVKVRLNISKQIKRFQACPCMSVFVPARPCPSLFVPCVIPPASLAATHRLREIHACPPRLPEAGQTQSNLVKPKRVSE